MSVLSVLLLLGSFACTEEQQGPPVKPKVGFVVANKQLNYSKEMGLGFIAGVNTVGGVGFQVDGPNIVDGPRQVALFRDMLKATPDGLSVFTLSPDLLAEPMAEAVAGGVPIIAVDSQPLATADVDLFIGNDSYELGRLLAREVIGKLPADASGKIVLGTSGPGVPVLDHRAKGIRDEFTERLPGVSVLGPFDTKQEVEANQDAWSTLVKVNSSALAFIGTGDADGWNLAEIRRNTGATWLAAAFDIDSKALAAVKAGDLLLVSPEHYVKGAVAGRLQADHAKTGKVLPAGWLYVPGIVVDQSNVDAIQARQATVATRAEAFATQIDHVLNDPSYLRPLAEVR
ncbi:sugar ABC transporter substrate-binding protein [Actinoplanes derwentensis]|uniref:Ribose transport system substrate-binding protein n=1 Tax=Actinoplanes derwentensis TaxID=113562 RepID=A0A1H2C708_9ACTN|nr:substrate-binding domain-containing protein [Actinoplanes derwentensis]GID84261.1 sugar ABC transporter substrate-binding protein [Actinoplanes derwentensis]SDT66203.1 ribose transport system substrate-binding protein [Actinoplanes derwentensis]